MSQIANKSGSNGLTTTSGKLSPQPVGVSGTLASTPKAQGLVTITNQMGGTVKVDVRPYMQSAGDVFLSLKEAGLDVQLDRHGRLVFADGLTLSGDSTILATLGF